MKRSQWRWWTPAVACTFVLLSCQMQQKDNSMVYESVEGDPLKVRIYTLDNGLKVYLSVNKEEPRIFTNIAVRAGSKQDPEDATGLAHYLEHMMFKGGDQLGTIDWEKERPIIEAISALYEEHKATPDLEEKKRIYSKIDSLSAEAAAFAAPNEYDKITKSLGAQATNAYTSYDKTVYVNDIPSNELEKWLLLESVRFKKLVLRLFHTELETVYEEFNRGLDTDSRKAFYKMAKLLFPGHPYGERTTIGKGEHLKNPSMVKIHEYFDKYYVPNNMAIVLSGDLDYDQTLAWVKQYFGEFKTRPFEPMNIPSLAPLTEAKEADVYGPQNEWVNLAFRSKNGDWNDLMMMDLIGTMLDNGQAGLVDLNLLQKQAIQRGGAGAWGLDDFSVLYLQGYPKQGQTLDEVTALLLEQVDKIKAGDYDSSLVGDCIRHMKLTQMRKNLSNKQRVGEMTNAFVRKERWERIVNYYDEMEKISPADITAFAQQHFGENYVRINKRNGQDTSVYKVDKPHITPIELDRTKESAFKRDFDTLASNRIAPVFVDYQSAISETGLPNDVPLFYVQNTINELFTLTIVLDMGSAHDAVTEQAINYFPYLGTTAMDPVALKRRFFGLGIEYDATVSRNQIKLTLSGLHERFEDGLVLFEDLLSDLVPDEDAWKQRIEVILKDRQNAKKNKSDILRKGLFNYARYGEKNYFNQRLSEEALRAITPEQLVAKISALLNHPHRVLYYGPASQQEIASLLSKHHKSSPSPQGYPDPLFFQELPTDQNVVYFADYDMVQTELMLMRRASDFDPSIVPYARIYNNYFGTGLSSIVFQEIRETKALAYSAYSYLSTPRDKDDGHFLMSYVGTQSDKLSEATTVMLSLMNDMPEAADQYMAARDAALKSIETNRITQSALLSGYERIRKLGLDTDPREATYGKIQGLELADLKQFFGKQVKEQPFKYLVIGKKSEVDFEALKRLGTVEELTLEELFGY